MATLNSFTNEAVDQQPKIKSMVFENTKNKCLEQTLREFDQIVAAPWLVTEQECKSTHGKLLQLKCDALAGQLKTLWLARDYIWLPTDPENRPVDKVESDKECNEVQPPFEGVQKRRPNVVIDNEEKDKDPVLGSRKWIRKLERFFKRSRRQEEKACKKRYPPRRCPFTKMDQKDCWCLQREHAKECSLCGCVYNGDRCRDFDMHDSYNCSFDSFDGYDSIFGNESTDRELNPWDTDYSSDYSSQLEMPNSESDEEHASVLIHIYLKECVENIHHMIGLWTHQHLVEIRESCIHLLGQCKIMDQLVGGVFYIGDRNVGPPRTLPQQKEMMFVDTD